MRVLSSPPRIIRTFACLVLVFVFGPTLVALFGYQSPQLLPLHAFSFNYNSVPATLVQNATLGFEAILAVSPRASWRSDGLIRAAKRTNIKIDIPTQNNIPEDTITQFLGNGNDGYLTHNSAVAWLAHLDMLRLAMNYSTALILEDDVDWDVDIKRQLPPIASAIRNFTNPTTNPNGSPYGEDWDVLWLGHCGERLAPPPSSPEEMSFIKVQDPTVPEKVKTYDDNIRQPNGSRYIQWVQGPICTFAYAVTKKGAAKILDMEHGNEQAWDLWLHTRCTAKDLLRCVSVTPELFHHHKAGGFPASLVNADGRVVEGDNSTANILHSARCNADSQTLVSCIEPVD